MISQVEICMQVTPRARAKRMTRSRKILEKYMNKNRFNHFINKCMKN